METLFEQLLGLIGLHIFKVETKHDGYFLHCETYAISCRCTKCGHLNTKVKQTYVRTIRDLPISGKRVYLILYSKQYDCEQCHTNYYEKYDFVEPNQNTTNRYSDYLYFLSKGADLSYVSEKENISYKTVTRIVRRCSQQAVKAFDGYKTVKKIGIDEIALRKGHRDFVVVICDLDTHKIIDILENRDKKGLIKHFQDKGQSFCERIEIFCSDMWEGYLNTAKEVFPNAVITADRFHAFAKLQDGLDSTRKYLRKTFKDDETLKGIRYLLLKNPKNLNDNEQNELNAIFDNKNYLILKQSYEAKNEFRDIYQTETTPQNAEKLIEQWIEKYTKNRFLFLFIKFYKSWKSYIINYFHNRLTTSIVEGINNKLKLIKRRAFGFLTFESFRLKAITEFL
jgi:transposase